jgi:putative aldouronate transport system substrate-binding protein
MISKFVTGKEPMENWDTFVAQLKKLGAEEVTRAKQAQYDRATR